MAYERHAGPLGPARADFHAALIASHVANLFAEKDSQVRPITDFMPDWAELSEEAARGDD
jgi:hypothetical protein